MHVCVCVCVCACVSVCVCMHTLLNVWTLEQACAIPGGGGRGGGGGGPGKVFAMEAATPTIFCGAADRSVVCGVRARAPP
jgi:hypothetical protein